MDRLTSNKDVLDMNSYELAHNCCYVKDGNARYRDGYNDIDCRDFIREICNKSELWGYEVETMTDDNKFDDCMEYYLNQFHYTTAKGLIALLYRNMWAMAELRETLKQYEDAEQSGKLTGYPVGIGDTVYIVRYCLEPEGFKIYEKTIYEIAIYKHDTFFKVENQSGFNLKEFGKTVFKTREAAEQALSKIQEVQLCYNQKQVH